MADNRSTSTTVTSAIAQRRPTRSNRFPVGRLWVTQLGPRRGVEVPNRVSRPTRGSLPTCPLADAGVELLRGRNVCRDRGAPMGSEVCIASGNDGWGRPLGHLDLPRLWRDRGLSGADRLLNTKGDNDAVEFPSAEIVFPQFPGWSGFTKSRRVHLLCTSPGTLAGPLEYSPGRSRPVFVPGLPPTGGPRRRTAT